MKTFFKIKTTLFSFVIISVLSNFFYSQISIPNATPVTQNFDGMGTGAALPAFWEMSAAGAGVAANFGSAGNWTDANNQVCGGSPTAGGRYNWGVSAACTDRALGFMTSGTYGGTNSIMNYYSNTSGAVITDITLTFDVERYRINTSNFSLTFFSSTNGSVWTARNTGDIATGVFATGASAYNFITPQTVSKSVTISGVNIPNGGSIYFKWVINTVGSNSQGIGLDNVILTATVPSCSPPAEPTVQASSVSVSSITATSIQVNWVRGNGGKCIVVAKPTSAISSYPVDATNYTASPVYGSGSTTGAAQYVVYQNTGTSVVVGGLSPNTTYYFEVYEYNESVPCTNYLSSNTGSASGTTLVAPSYNFYRGNIHSHTAYSDGDMDGVCPTFGSAATCCYNVAKTALYFDFMGIADHNHNEGPAMTIPKYQSGIAESGSFNVANAGVFAALYGMEWGSISTGGHACVYGVDQLVGWNAGNYEVFVAKGDYDALFNLIAGTANAFAYLAHPNSTDYGGIFTNAYNATYDDAVIGVSLKNGPYNSTNTTYTDPPGAGTDEIRYKDLLKIGYHVGPGIDLDNHNSNNMGKSSQGRTVVLASSLSKSNVIDAYRNRRFYATEDYNVNVFYTINSTILMGSITTGNVNPVIEVNIVDLDPSESVSSIEVWYGVPGSGIAATILTSNTLSSTLNYTHTLAPGSTFYYYIKILQADGSRIWTAPIWYTMGTPLPIELINFDVKLINGNFVETNWETISEKDNDYFVIEKTRDGINFEMIEKVKGQVLSTISRKYKVNDTKPYSGQSYYRLKQVDIDGKEFLSDLRPINFANKGNENLWVYPNPTSNEINITSKLDTRNSNVDIYIYNVLGELIFEKTFDKGNNGEFKIDLTEFSKGIYFLNFISGNENHSVKVLKQ